jgi:glutamine amidotransferase
MIAVVDYGMGNLKSVRNAARLLGARIVVTDNSRTLRKADKIIFPGVGHFGRTVQELKKRKLFDLLKEKIKEGIPFLGICVGMQVLFQESQEAPGIRGLGVLEGRVKKFSSSLIVPHMGWNQIKLQPSALSLQQSALFRGIKEGSYFYFVHSYYCLPEDRNVIAATTDYGVSFASSVNKRNVWAVQFHAEKSQELGLKLFDNFLKLC